MKYITLRELVNKMVSVTYNPELVPDIRCPKCGTGYDIEDMNDVNPQIYMCGECHCLIKIEEIKHISRVGYDELKKYCWSGSLFSGFYKKIPKHKAMAMII